LEAAIRQPGVGKAALERLRDRQAWLLLDVAIEHEIDLAGDIACYGRADFPMITRLLRAVADRVPGFEFNSLRRWLGSPGQYDQVVGNAASGDDRLCAAIGFGKA